MSSSSAELSSFMTASMSRVITNANASSIPGTFIVTASDPTTSSTTHFTDIPEASLRPYVMAGRVQGIVNKEAMVWSHDGAGIVIDSAQRAGRSMSNSSADREGIVAL
ncbi:hypothetical protein HDU67_004628 [Dinochytrium kinnereticum]|nr:hypothetical protein HDU67_004628 [Dinochytrium kinnereticum]